MDARFNSIDHRLDHLRDLSQSEIHRVEKVLRTRLKQLEES